MSRWDIHPLAGAPFHQWRSLEREYGPARGGRARISKLLSLLGAPLRGWEQARYGDAIAASEPVPPLFVLGVWRSGTSFLQQLLTADPRFGTPRTVHPTLPLASLATPWLSRLVDRVLPAERRLDGVPQGAALPEEEELGLSHMGAPAIANGFYFPAGWATELRRTLHPAARPAEREAFTTAYLALLRKLSYCEGGRPLVLKNPPSMGRIPWLLELFPGARFVFISRHPYALQPSLLRWSREQHALALQPIAFAEWHARMLLLCRQLVDAYLRDRSSIPTCQHAVLRYEDLTLDPLGALERVYAQLGWDLAGPARGAIGGWLARFPTRPARVPDLAREARAEAERYFGPLAEAFGYELS